MSNDALILRLSADLTPIRRRSPWREAGLLLLVCAAELALVVGMGLMRPDMGRMIGSAYMIWKLGGLAVLAVICSAVAVRSFAPTTTPGKGPLLAAALAVVTLVAGSFLSPDSVGGEAILDRLSPVHGLMCSSSIVIVSLPILSTMALLMQRGAPTHPRASALASGMAAAMSGALIFAFCCPMNDPLYVIVWYSLGCLAIVGMARWLLPGRIRL